MVCQHIYFKATGFRGGDDAGLLALGRRELAMLGGASHWGACHRHTKILCAVHITQPGRQSSSIKSSVTSLSPPPGDLIGEPAAGGSRPPALP